ncbi:hypothetical protein DDP54_08755 [Cellulomonas sp. WB94]|nr:hypothetical protein DDP54_08755 [Cellulomonas sp. WB94]
MRGTATVTALDIAMTGASSTTTGMTASRTHEPVIGSTVRSRRPAPDDTAPAAVIRRLARWWVG